MCLYFQIFFYCFIFDLVYVIGKIIYCGYFDPSSRQFKAMPAITAHYIKYVTTWIKFTIINNKINFGQSRFLWKDMAPYLLIIAVEKGTINVGRFYILRHIVLYFVFALLQ